jgi:quinone-modifying oxidoreductase subunit QmoC
VKPASVISAVRQQTYEHYVWPGFLGRMVSRPQWLPVALGIPVAVIIAILSLAGTFAIPDGPVDYSRFFPHVWLNATFSGLTLLFWSFSFAGFGAFWKDMKRNHPVPPAREQHGKNRLPLFKVLGEVLVHSNFSACGSNTVRRLAHMAVFFGFGLLILVTLYAIWASLTGNYPLSPGNPFKIAGNIASLMIYTGAGTMVLQRIFNREVFGKSNYADWLLLGSVLLLTLSGTLVQLARFGNWSIAYYLYFFHLVAVWFVIMYLPYGKLGHMIYRSMALLYARSIGRK